MKRILVDSGEYGTRIGVVEDGLLPSWCTRGKILCPLLETYIWERS